MTGFWNDQIRFRNYRHIRFGNFILSDRDAELERIANKMELLRLSTCRKQNAYFLLERILCRETVKRPRYYRWFANYLTTEGNNIEK